MNKTDLKKYIARTAYNVGFGAKKNYASYDIVRNANEYISIISMIIGVLALVSESLNGKFISASLLIAGIVGLYINKFDCDLERYEKIGKNYLRLFNSLTKLYLKANQTNDENDLINIERDVSIIEDEFYRERFSKQVYLSDWVAHYKFFFQYQSDWVVKELNLKFCKDKIPSSFKLILLIFIVFCITFIAYNYHSFFINSLENLFKK